MPLPRTARSTALTVALALAVTACGSGGSSVQIGLRRISLDLAFKAEEAAKPPPTAVLQPTPVAGQTDVAILTPRAKIVDARLPAPPPTRPPVVDPIRCPGPPEGTFPEVPVDIDINKPIRQGRFSTRISGYFVAEGGAFPVKVPLPTEGQFVIRNVVPATNPVGDRNDSFEVYRPGAGTNFSTTLFKLTPNQLQLGKIITKNDSGENTFAPVGNPPYMNLGANGEGNPFQGAGTDPATGSSIVIVGTVVKRENVRVCDDVIEAFRVETSERYVDVRGRVVSQTTDVSGECRPGPTGAACRPSKNIRWIATQYGGLIVKEELHVQQSIGAQTLWVEKTETVNSVKPLPAEAK